MPVRCHLAKVVLRVTCLNSCLVVALWMQDLYRTTQILKCRVIFHFLTPPTMSECNNSSCFFIFYNHPRTAILLHNHWIYIHCFFIMSLIVYCYVKTIFNEVKILRLWFFFFFSSVLFHSFQTFFFSQVKHILYYIQYYILLHILLFYLKYSKWKQISHKKED